MPNYYIIGKMGHTISDATLELHADISKKENALKQFSDLFDEALKQHAKEIFVKIQSHPDWKPCLGYACYFDRIYQEFVEGKNDNRCK